MASKAVTPEVVRPLCKAGPRPEKPRGRKKLCFKILIDKPEKEHLEAERQIKEAKKSKKKSRAARKRTAKRNITADLDEEEDFVLSNTSSDESLHIGDTEEDGEALLRLEGIEEGDFFSCQSSWQEDNVIFCCKGLGEKDEIEDEIQLLFWKRIFPSYKFQETTEKGRVSVEDALMKLPKPIPSGGTARQASLHTFGVDFSGFSVL